VVPQSLCLLPSEGSQVRIMILRIAYVVEANCMPDEMDHLRTASLPIISEATDANLLAGG
jgi:hypothetical protein